MVPRDVNSEGNKMVVPNEVPPLVSIVVKRREEKRREGERALFLNGTLDFFSFKGRKKA